MWYDYSIETLENFSQMELDMEMIWNQKKKGFNSKYWTGDVFQLF